MSLSLSPTARTSLLASTASSKKPPLRSDYSYDSKLAILKEIQEQYSSFNKSAESKQLQKEIKNTLNLLNEEVTFFPSFFQSINKKTPENKEEIVNACFDKLTQFYNNSSYENKSLHRTTAKAVNRFESEPSEFSYSKAIKRALCYSIPNAFSLGVVSLCVSGAIAPIAAPIVAPCVFVGTILVSVTFSVVNCFLDKQRGIKHTSKYETINTREKFKNLDTTNRESFSLKLLKIAQECDELSKQHKGNESRLFNKQERELLDKLRNSNSQEPEQIKQDIINYLYEKKKDLNGYYFTHTGTVLFQAIHAMLNSTP